METDKTDIPVGEHEQTPIIMLMDPIGFEMYPIHPALIPPLTKVALPEVTTGINDSVSWSAIIALYIKETLIQKILTMKGGTMSNDNKATVTGIATGLIALVGLFGFTWSIEVVTTIVTVGVMVLGFFTNKPATPVSPDK